MSKASRFEPAGTIENLATWAAEMDTDTWHSFDNQSVGAYDIESYHNDVFPAGDIYICPHPAYPFSRTQRLMTDWLADPRASDTASSTAGVIGTSTSRDAGDGSGRTVSALEFYGFKLTNNSGFTKNKAILVGGNHPNETLGRFQLEGALAWLLAGSAEAESLLDWFEFYVYPCTNPQGVWAGYTRSQPEDPTKDHNREWDTGGLECVDAFKAAFLADTGGTIELGIDFHSGNAASGYMVVEDHTAAMYDGFLTRMQAYNAQFSYADLAIDGFLNYLWNHSYSCRLGLVVERMPVAGTDLVVTAKTQGQNAMKVLADMLADGLFTNGPA